MSDNLEEKLMELLSNSFMTSHDYHTGEDFEYYLFLEIEHRLNKIVENRTLYNFKIQVEDDKNIQLHYRRQKTSPIEAIEFKGMKRNKKIDDLLND